MAERLRPGVLKNTKGNIAEKEAARWLSTLDGVKGVKRTKKNSLEDQQGKDLIVEVDTEYLGTQTVFVQVKSSSRAIKDYKKRVMTQRGLDMNNVNEWFISHRIVLLNGMLPPDQLLWHFARQVNAIKEYNRTRS